MFKFFLNTYRLGCFEKNDRKWRWKHEVDVKTIEMDKQKWTYSQFE
jgi:hypothetical protein